MSSTVASRNCCTFPNCKRTTISTAARSKRRFSVGSCSRSDIVARLDTDFRVVATTAAVRVAPVTLGIDSQALLQQLECSCRPVVMRDTRNAPEHTKGFDRARCFRPYPCLRTPSRTVPEFPPPSLGGIVIAADEHRRLSVFKSAGLRFGAAPPTELNALTKLLFGKLCLEPLHERLIWPGEVLQYTVDRRRIGNRIGRIDNWSHPTNWAAPAKRKVSQLLRCLSPLA